MDGKIIVNTLLLWAVFSFAASVILSYLRSYLTGRDEINKKVLRGVNIFSNYESMLIIAMGPVGLFLLSGNILFNSVMLYMKIEFPVISKLQLHEKIRIVISSSISTVIHSVCGMFVVVSFFYIFQDGFDGINFSAENSFTLNSILLMSMLYMIANTIFKVMNRLYVKQRAEDMKIGKDLDPGDDR